MRNFPRKREVNINYLMEREDNVNFFKFYKSLIGSRFLIMKRHIVTSAMQISNSYI